MAIKPADKLPDPPKTVQEALMNRELQKQLDAEEAEKFIQGKLTSLPSVQEVLAKEPEVPQVQTETVHTGPMISIWDVAQKKCDDIDVQIKFFAGKPGFNPFLWAKNVGWDRIKSGVAGKDESVLPLLKAITTPINPKINPKAELPDLDSFYPPITKG